MGLGETWLEVCKGLGAVTGAVKGTLLPDKDTVDWESQDFFTSYETSYSMTLAYPDDLLIESARAAGIPVDGRDKLDIVRDMVVLQRQREQEQHHESS